MATDLYKTKRNLAAAIIHEFFEQRNIQQYYLRSQTDFQLGLAKTVNYRLRTLRYLDPQIWNIVPLEVKNSDTFEQLKTKIKSWNPTLCKKCSYSELMWSAFSRIWTDRIQSECSNIRTRITPNADTSHKVLGIVLVI